MINLALAEVWEFVSTKFKLCGRDTFCASKVINSAGLSLDFTEKISLAANFPGRVQSTQISSRLHSRLWQKVCYD